MQNKKIHILTAFYGAIAMLLLIAAYRFLTPASIMPSSFHITSEADLLGFVSMVITFFGVLTTAIGVFVTGITIFYTLRTNANEQEFRALRDANERQINGLRDANEREISDLRNAYTNDIEEHAKVALAQKQDSEQSIKNWDALFSKLSLETNDRLTRLDEKTKYIQSLQLQSPEEIKTTILLEVAQRYKPANDLKSEILNEVERDLYRYIAEGMQSQEGLQRQSSQARSRKDPKPNLDAP